MIGLGTIINCAAIIVGGICGLFFGKIINERIQDSLTKASGVCVLFIGVAGALEGMLGISEGKIVSGKSMLLVLCIALGTLLGEIINIEEGFEKFGEWLKVKTGNSKDNSFLDAFLTASLTVSIGAMAIVGSIEDGLSGDFSILAAKSVLDLIIILIMTCAMGKGAIFSAIPVGILQGSVTLLASFLRPIMTEAALSNLSFIGAVLIFCVGVNLIWGKMIKVANMLPSVIFAVIAAFLPWF